MRKRFERKLFDVAKKHPRTVPIIRVYYLLISKPLDYIMSLFERDVKLSVNTLTVDGVIYPDTIRGIVINGRAAYSFSNVPYEELDNLLETFKEEHKPIDFEVEYGSGWYQRIRLTPKLRKLMVDRLEELKNEHGIETYKVDVKI